MAKKGKKKAGKGKGGEDERRKRKHAGKAGAGGRKAKAERKQDAKGKGKKGKKGKDQNGKKGKGGRGSVEQTPALAEQQTAAGTDLVAVDQPAAPPVAPEPPDQVALLKLALRDTEAKLVAAEHRLGQVQQQLDDERRALAEASGSSIEAEEAVVDAAVAETVAEALVAAEIAAAATVEAPGTADPGAVAAATLEDAADAIDAALASGEAGDGAATEPTAARQAVRSDAETAFTGARSGLTPPLPEQGSDDVPNEGWTLVHLRKEAERRGITGVSNLPKAALIERLRA